MTITICIVLRFLSTLSLRRATTHPVTVFIRVIISIHALLAESDCCARCHCWGLNEFLSTLSLRRATQVKQTCRVKISISIHALLAESDSLGAKADSPTKYFYPRSPCGERRWLRCWQLAARDISIHALLAESDVSSFRFLWC